MLSSPLPASAKIKPSIAFCKLASALVTSSSVASSLERTDLANNNVFSNAFQDLLVYLLESKASALLIKSCNLSLLGFNLNSKNDLTNLS